jgi:Tol biopolymer transport system component
MRLTRTTLAAGCAAIALAGAVGHAQAPAPPPVPQAERARIEAEDRARAIARAVAENARQLTVFDKQGTVVATVAEKGLYNQPVFSPDRTRIAVIKSDPLRETNELWVVDLATGAGTPITESKAREPVQAPAWSPDGTQVAYVALRGSRYGIYRKPSTGSGAEEPLYQHAGGPIVLTDWSLDGRMLSFYAADLSGGILYLLPVDGERRPVEITRSTSQIVAARLSPDSRFLAYRSDETGRNEIFVRALPPAGSTEAVVGKWQVSNEGGLGMVWWRRDGQELYFMGPERAVMVVQVKAGQDFEFSRPRTLFKAPDAIPLQGTPGGLGSVSRDGERVVFAVPPAPPLRQLAVYDRGGKVVSRIGQPGMYLQPAVSPDGSRVAVMRQDPQTGNVDIWALEIASGRATAITADAVPDTAPIWSPDGSRVAYVSTRGNYAAVYRRPATGQGAEEQLFRYTPGAGMVLTDLSADGKFMTVDGGGVVLVVPLNGTDALKREAVDFARSEYEAGAGRFSPDGRFIAYGSNESGRFEVYVRPFDTATASAAGDTKYPISSDGAMGGIFWRRDGKELYYLSEDRAASEVKVMAVDVTTSPAFTATTPRVLFRLPGPLPGNPAQWKNITADGQRFVFATPVPAGAASR